MSSTSNDRKAFEKKLTALAKKPFIPEPLLGLVRTVSIRQIEAVDDARIGEIGGLSSHEDLLRGKPLMPRENFPVDLDQARVLFGEFSGIARNTPPLDMAVQAVLEALDEGALDLGQAFQAFLKGDDPWLESIGREKTPESPRCLNFLVQSSLTPGLIKAESELSLLLPSSQAWDHGHCPLCGSLPLIGRLKDKEGFRMLTCSFCRHEYRVQRLGCPYCGERKSEKLEYFDAEDEPGVMVEVCRSCNGYIKTLDFRKFDVVCIPVLDDLGTLPFDILAQKRGFSRPSLSAWGF
jgi:FdhE protein